MLAAVSAAVYKKYHIVVIQVNHSVVEICYNP